MADQNLQPALDAAQNELALTFSASDSLDTRALGILGYDLAVGIFSLQTDLHRRIWVSVPLYILLIVSITLTLFIIFPRNYSGAIVDLDLHPEYFELSEEELVAQLLTDTQDSIARNASLNSVKANYYLAAIITSILSTLSLIGCIIKI